MSEEINQDTGTLEAVSNEEVAVEQETAVTEASEEQVVVQSAPQPDEPAYDARRENIKALRDSRNRLQAERDQYAAKLKAMEEAQHASVAQASMAQSKRTEDDDTGIDDLDYEDANTKDLRVIKKHLAEMSVTNSRMKLQTQYPDFNNIVTQDSIAILKERFPEIAATLDQSNDIYNTGVSAYNIIKKFELHKFEDYEDQKSKVETNINKPRPAETVKASSALVHASDYSDLKNKDTRSEIIRMAMERASNG